MKVTTDFAVAAPADRVFDRLLVPDVLEAVAAIAAPYAVVGRPNPLDADDESRAVTFGVRIRHTSAPSPVAAELGVAVSGSADSAHLALSLGGDLTAFGVSDQVAREAAELTLEQVGARLADVLTAPETEVSTPVMGPASAPTESGEVRPRREPDASAPAEPERGSVPRPALAAAAAGTVLAAAVVVFSRRRGDRLSFEIKYRW